MKNLNSILLLLSVFFAIGCSPNMPEMDGQNQRIATKYEAEWAGTSFEHRSVRKMGRLVEDTKYLVVKIQNSSDIIRVFEDKNYGNKRSRKIADFVRDSLQFANLPERPEALKIEFVKLRQFLGTESTSSSEFIYELDSLKYQVLKE